MNDELEPVPEPTMEEVLALNAQLSEQLYNSEKQTAYLRDRNIQIVTYYNAAMSVISETLENLQHQIKLYTGTGG